MIIKDYVFLQSNAGFKMKRYLNRLSLIGIIGVILFVSSCSKEEVNPLQKYFGIYDIYTKGIPAADANDNYPNSGFRLVIREANENKVTVSFYAEAVSPNSDKVSTFSNCEIMPLLVFLLRKKNSQPLCGVFHPQHGRKQAPTMKARCNHIINMLKINNLRIFVSWRVAFASVVGGKHRTTARQDFRKKEHQQRRKIAPILYR